MLGQVETDDFSNFLNYCEFAATVDVDFEDPVDLSVEK